MARFALAALVDSGLDPDPDPGAILRGPEPNASYEVLWWDGAAEPVRRHGDGWFDPELGQDPAGADQGLHLKPLDRAASRATPQARDRRRVLALRLRQLRRDWTRSLLRGA